MGAALETYLLLPESAAVNAQSCVQLDLVCKSSPSNHKLG